MIDLSAGFPVVVSLTGLVVQLLLRRNRTLALAIAGLGGLLTVILMVVTVG